MNKEIKYFSVLIFSVFILLLFSSKLVLGAVTCVPINGDLTNQGCIEEKDKPYNTTTPIINITFNESVDVNDDFVLYKIGELGEDYPSENLFDPVFLDNLNYIKNYSLQRISAYSYRPTVHIPNGIYLFKVSAFNIPNIKIDVSALFSINGTSMKFWVSSPTNDLVGENDKPLFAFSNEEVFDLELTAERDVEGCRFTTGEISGSTSLANAYMSAGERFSNTGDPRKVVYRNFTITEHYPYPVYDGSRREMYVICKEAGSERYAYNVVVVGVDQSAPAINVTSDFSPVVDYDSRRTNITIKTDDMSACKIDKVYTQLPDMNGLPLIIRDSSYDFTKYSEFVKTYAELLIFSANPVSYNYTFNITCTNLANLRSSKLYVINVQLNNIQSFEFYSPSSGYTNKRTVLINGSVNRGGTDVYCNASLNKSAPFTVLTRKTGETFNGRQIYSNSITVPSDGTYTVYVNCKYMYETFSSQTFTVDTIAPTAPNVTSDENSCSLDKITITAVSKDNVSGIRRYYYNLTVNAAANEYASGSSSSGKISIDINDNDLEEGSTYPIKIWAEDNAGNIGPMINKNIKITDDSSITCDKTPPSIKISAVQNNATNAWTVTVNCTDKESGCKTSFMYGIETNSSKECNKTKTANLLSPIPVSSSSTFCAIVYDNNNNNDSDSKELTVTYPVNCNNNATDGEETDLNCGGDCPKCGLNKTCSKDADCTSNYCLNEKCTQSSCTDKIKNGNEAGVDCGGSCLQKCSVDSINVTCISDDDCVTANCLSGKCEAASCTDKKTDGEETDTDCGGADCPVCSRNQKCESNSDCSTRYCVPFSKVCDIDPLLDSDGDGLTDLWEEKNCGSFTGCDPKGDLDGDGYTNIEESDANTDPLDATDFPDYKKYNIIAVILLILGILLIIAGGVMKTLNVLDEQKKKKFAQEKEMFGTLNQIPKMSSIEKPAERELTEEERARGQQARLKALKERNAERKKMINQFDSDNDMLGISSSDKPAKETAPAKETESSKEKSQSAEKEQKPIPAKKKTLDEGITDEYVDLSSLKAKKQSEDPFSKLKNITENKSSDSPAKKTEKKSDEKRQGEQLSLSEKSKAHLDKANHESSKKQQAKSSKDEDVFEKLKTLSKSKKK